MCVWSVTGDPVSPYRGCLVMDDPGGSTAICHVTDHIMQRHLGKAVVTFSSQLTGKEEELASDTDTPLTLSPLTISAHEMDLDQSSTAANLPSSGISTEPPRPTLQQAGVPAHGDSTPTLPITSQVPHPLHFSTPETGSSRSSASVKSSVTKTKMRVPTSKLREIASPKPARSFMTMPSHEDDAPSED